MAQKGVNRETVSCSICLDLLKDPVTIPCGHSYCMNCIKSHWDGEEEKKIYSCPQCRQTFTPRPVLVKNTMLAALVEELKKTGLQDAPADHCYAGPEDVACDVCTGRKLKALKSCLMCTASYCEKHLQPHYESPSFKKHKLVEPSNQLQENICPHHDEVMKMFCRTYQQCICYLCSVEEHKGHDTVSAAAERTERQRELEGRRQNIQQRIQDRKKDVKVLQQEVKNINRSADKAVEDSEKMLTEMISLMEKKRSDVKRQVRSQQQTEVSRVLELQEKLEQEISKLKRKDAELKKLSHTEDHNQFLHNYPSVSAFSEATHSSSINIRPLRHFEDVTAAVTEARDKLQDLLTQTWTNISQTGIRVNALPPLAQSQPPPRLQSQPPPPARSLQQQLPRSQSLKLPPAQSLLRQLLRSPARSQTPPPAQSLQQQLPPAQSLQQQLPPAQSLKLPPAQSLQHQLPPAQSLKHQLPPAQSLQQQLPPAQSLQQQLPPAQSLKLPPAQSLQHQLPPAQSLQQQLPPAQSLKLPPAQSLQHQLPPAQSLKHQLPPAQSLQQQLPPAQSLKLPPAQSLKHQLPPAQSLQHQLPPAQSLQQQLPPAQSLQQQLPPAQSLQRQLPWLQSTPRPKPEPEPKTRAEFLKYSREITLDRNTAHTKLLLSDGNRKVTNMSEDVGFHPYHPDRFIYYRQVLSKESLTGRCYWEVEWSREIGVAVTYKNISRTGGSDECEFGRNDKSWSLVCSNNSYEFLFNKIKTNVSGPWSSRVGVYLDHRAGILSFYRVSETMTLLHRVQTTFTQPLYAGLCVYDCESTAEFIKLN